MRERLEYAAVVIVLRGIGALPRALAHAVGCALGLVAYAVLPKLRRVGMRNLDLAFPHMPRAQKKRIIRKLYLGLGRQLAEFCRFPRYTRENVEQIAVYEGFENYARALAAGKGVIILTGHFGGWEVGSFAASVYGNPLRIVIRELDNRRINALVNHYRTLYGNVLVDNRDFARGLIGAVRRGEAVGILMDTNMTPPQGIFVDYFGRAACTAAGVARIAAHTDAAVVPGFTIWDDALRKYRIIFEAPLKLTHSGDAEADVVANTARFTKKLQEYAERYPDQWLWLHRRWKTRPTGEAGIY